MLPTSILGGASKGSYGRGQDDKRDRHGGVTRADEDGDGNEAGSGNCKRRVNSEEGVDMETPAGKTISKVWNGRIYLGVRTVFRPARFAW